MSETTKNQQQKRKKKADAAKIVIPVGLPSTNDNTYGISETRFHDVIRYLICWTIHQDLISCIQPTKESKSSDDSSDMIVVENIPPFISWFQSLEVHFTFFKTCIEQFCESIYTYHDKKDIYSTICSCINYKLNVNKTKIEVVPNKMILWKGEGFYFEPSIRSAIQPSTVSFEQFLEQPITQFPYSIRYKKESKEPYTLTEINQLDEIIWMSHSIFALSNMILDFLQEKEINIKQIAIEFMDKTHHSEKLTQVIHSVITMPKMEQFRQTFNRLYQKYKLVSQTS